MILNTCVTLGTDNYVIITETTDGEQYLPEDSKLTAKNRFEYKDTVSVDIFRLNATTGVTFTPATIVVRSNPEDARILLDRDGWFTSIHIVVPSKNWVYKELDKQGSIINTYDIVYCADKDGIYTCVGGELIKSNIQELIAETSTNTTISRKDSDYVSISLLQNQNNELYSALFQNRLYNGGCGTDACKANRLVTAINLIKHYVRWGQLAEAERIIEKLNNFNEANKKKSKKDEKKTGDCGCL